MTDRENSPKGFLERWSRQKIESERKTPAEPRATDVSLPDEPRLPGRDAKNAAEAPAKAAPEPEFDLASLPSLDSITAATDIRAFLGAGVPRELARAALRRAWAADPAIRDFKGLAENDWDFTDPKAMPGFGALPEGTDIKNMLAQIFGESERPTDPDAAASLRVPQEIDKPSEIAVAETHATAAPSAAGVESTAAKGAEDDPPVAEADLLHRSNNIAPHSSNSDDEPEERKKRRQHGTALPQ